MKTMTLRISDEQHSQLVEIARLRGTSVQAEIREAITAYIEARRTDPEFQARLERYRAAQEAVYRRLVSPEYSEEARELRRGLGP